MSQSEILKQISIEVDNISKKIDIVQDLKKEVEKLKANLETNSNILENDESLSVEIKELSNKLSEIELQIKTNIHNSTEDKITSFINELNERTNKITENIELIKSGIDVQIEELSNKQDDSNKKLSESVFQNQAAIQESIEKTITLSLNNSKTQITQIKSKIELLENNLVQNTKKQDNHTSEFNAINQRLEKLNTTIAFSEKSILSQSENQSKLINQISKLQEELRIVNELSVSLKTKLSTRENQVLGIVDNINKNINKNYYIDRDKLNLINDKMNELENSIKSFKQENNNLKEKHKLQTYELEDKIKFLKVVNYTTIWVLIGFMGFTIFFLKNMNSFKKVFSVFF
jgi:chromosome segregation ATPase